MQAREIAHQSNKLLEQCDRKVRSGAGPRRRLRARSDTIGALVLGGDYQGFGIVRSLGRRGIPVCGIDDEPSVARNSRYGSHTVRVPRLFAEEEILQHTLDGRKRLGTLLSEAGPSNRRRACARALRIFRAVSREAGRAAR